MKYSDNVANYKHQETEWEELPVVEVQVKTHCWFLANYARRSRSIPRDAATVSERNDFP